MFHKITVNSRGGAASGQGEEGESTSFDSELRDMTAQQKIYKNLGADS